MKILVITNVFPNSQEPNRGIYNLQQFQELKKFPGYEIQVIAPLPWSLPIKMNKKWYKIAQIPDKEEIAGFCVYHPRYLVIPKVLSSLHGFSLFLSLIGKVRSVQKRFPFDCILATWAYPDAFAASLIAQRFRKPLITKVHGSDINLYTKPFLLRKLVQYALRASARVIALSGELKNIIVNLGVSEDRVVIVGNGIDEKKFKFENMKNCRDYLHLNNGGKKVLFVGNLMPVKGVTYLLEAMKILLDKRKGLSLTVVGDGTDRPMLEAKAAELGIRDFVNFVGARKHSDIPLWLNASDILCLPSLKEGCPNVVLEAMACGKPVVASRVGGVPEIIKSEDFGILVEPQNPGALAEALSLALDKAWKGSVIREEALKSTWPESAQKLREVFEKEVKR